MAHNTKATGDTFTRECVEAAARNYKSASRLAAVSAAEKRNIVDHSLSPKGWVVGPWRAGRFSFVISRDDLWIGFYWGRDDGNLYFCPLPTLVFGVRLRATTDKQDGGLRLH